MTCEFTSSQQCFSHIRTIGVDNERLSAMELRFGVEKILPPAGIELSPLDQ